MKRISWIITILFLLCSVHSIFAQRKAGKSKSKKNSPAIVSCGVCNQEAIFLPKPEYPKAARAVKASGAVNIEILIGENGNVEFAKAVSGNLLLQSDSVKSALKAKFKPFTISGKPVKVRGTIVYNFIDDSTVQLQTTENIKTISLGILNEKAKVLPLPKLPNGGVRVVGSVNVEIKIDLQKGEVVSASAISGYPLLLMFAEIAARQAKFEPVLTEFPTIYGTGILTYKFEDFTGKVVENKNPKPFPIINNKDILNSKTTFFAAPVKTEEARAACVGGKVEVAILVNAITGEIIAAKGITGKEILYETVETAALKSKFSPAMIDGSGNIYVKGKFLYEFGVPKCGGSNVLNGKVLSIPKPTVKNSIRRRYLQSKSEQTVTVQVVVDETGAVGEAKALTGNPLLRPACEISARKAKFAPTSINMPLKFPGVLIYKFKPDSTISDDFPKL